MAPIHPELDSSALERLGFSDWFAGQLNGVDLKEHRIARVTAVHKQQFEIHDGNRSIRAEMTGRMEYGAESALDFPAVGDWVVIQIFDDASFAVIHDILPRRTLLKRKTSGKKVDIQLIAANVDKAWIIQSLESDFNLRRLERYLVMVLDGRIDPVVLLSKSDLVPHAEIRECIRAIERIEPDLQVVAFSNEKTSDIGRIRRLTAPGETFCMLGSSGVGKTTLLNHLLKEERFEIQEVREGDGKGRHTTARRQLIRLENGAWVIDTPGMRELGNLGVESGIADVFDEITALSPECRYADCTHTHEAGCAVTVAVKAGTIPEDRYASYVKLYKENLHYEQSALEKRRKERQFGRIVKNLKKYHPKY